LEHAPVDVIIRPRASSDGADWLMEIVEAELAIAQLLAAKRKVMRTDPAREQVLWTRYHDRLRDMKRQLDAVVM
jgi:hypothetical protein